MVRLEHQFTTQYEKLIISLGENAVEVMSLAHEYLLQRLADEAECFLAANLASDSVIELFSIANAINAKQLRRSCLYFIYKQHRQTFSTLPGYETMPKHLVPEVEAFMK